MQERELSYVCRGITTFSGSGKFDEEAFRQYLTRFIEPRIGVYVASSGSGAGQSLSWTDLERVYQSAVDVCKGKTPIGANIPEQFTSSLSIDHARLAAESGVDIINIYGPDGRHGFRPTDSEYTTYFDRIFAQVDYPISLCPNPVLGYTPSAAVIADLCNRYPQVKNVVLTGITGDDTYFIELMDALDHDVDVYVTDMGSLNTLGLGAAGIAGNLANLIPRTYRNYLDAFRAGNVAEASEIYGDIRRLTQFTAQWKAAPPRWHIMFLKVFNLPGGGGVLPDPYLMYPETEERRFRDGVLELGIPEIDELARAAGLKS